MPTNLVYALIAGIVLGIGAATMVTAKYKDGVYLTKIIAMEQQQRKKDQDQAAALQAATDKARILAIENAEWLSKMEVAQHESQKAIDRLSINNADLNKRLRSAKRPVTRGSCPATQPAANPSSSPDDATKTGGVVYITMDQIEAVDALINECELTNVAFKFAKETLLQIKKSPR